MSANRLFNWLVIVVMAICLYIIGSTIYISQTTGVLHLSSPDKNATLSIVQSGSEAKIIGVAKASVHLKPGTYQVSAVDNNFQNFAVVKVYKKQSASSSLSLTSSARLPSAEDINFQGTSALITNGLTVAQISSLKQAFFEYKKTAQKVEINTSSIYLGAHDPDVDTSFSINFNVSIDSSPYKAMVTYSDLDSVSLFLYNPGDNSLIFDSSNSK